MPRYADVDKLIERENKEYELAQSENNTIETKAIMYTIHNAIIDFLNNSKEADVVSRTDYKDAVNELCFECGRYTREHLGACNDCRWRDQR